MKIDTAVIVAVVAAIFGSTGFWQWLMSVSNKSIKSAIDDLHKQFDAMKQSEEEREIRNARRRILRFNDECLNDVKHSQEYFNDIISDINAYRIFCEKNPSYRNGKATLAIENIENVYRKCMAEHKFL